MSVDTLGVRFSAEGSENILSLIKQITTATGQLDGEIKKLTQTSQQASSGIGPAFSGLGNAMSSGEQKVKSLTDKFVGLQSAVSKQGTAFGTATASVWGIYNAYDSLEKVQLRASQSTIRVETLTTSLRSQEEQLRLARESGNLTAEQVAIKQDRIADTASKLTVAQERQTIMQEDVNEAWAGFVSLVGPQAISAFGSISQLVAGLTMAGEGQISMLGRLRGGFSSLIGSLSLTRTSGLAVNSTFQQMPIFTGAAEVGVRGLSGALKGLLIGTGIGAVIVAIGLLIESFDLLGTASGDMADQTAQNFKNAGDSGPAKFSNEVRTHMEKAKAIIEKYGSDTKFVLAEASSAYVKNVMTEVEADKIRMESAKAKAKIVYDSSQLEIDRLLEVKEQMDGLTIEEQKHLERMEAQKAAAENTYETSSQAVDQYRTDLAKLSTIYDGILAKEANVATQREQATTGIQDYGEATSNTFTEMHKLVDQWLADNSEMLKGMKGGNVAAIETATAFAKAHFGGMLYDEAINRLTASIDVLIPTEKDQQKTLDDTIKKNDELVKKITEVEKKFGVEVPAAVAASETALEAYGRVLEANKKLIDDWLSHADEFKNFGSASKALKLEFDAEKEVKDFIKDFDKETEKKIKIVIKREQGMQDFKNFFNEIQSIFFKQGKGKLNPDGTTTFEMEFRPIFNDSDAMEFKDELLDKLDQIFKGAKKPEYIKTLINQLNAADNKEEILKVLSEWGFLLESKTTEDATAAGQKAGAAYTSGFSDAIANDPFNILGGKKHKGVTTFDKEGNPIHTPVDESGKPINDFSAETKAAEDAAQKISDTFLDLSGKLSNIWLGMAKNWSGIMNSVINNAKSAGSGVTKNFLNMSGEASNIFMGLASNWSKMMNSMINNAKSAASGINKALDGIKDQDVTIRVGLSGPGVPYLDHEGAIHLAKGGIIDSAAAGQVYMTNGPQLVLIGDNPGGNEIHAMIPKNDPLPTVRSLLGVLGNIGNTNTSSITNNSSTISNFMGGTGPIIINITSPIYLDSQRIGEAVNREVIGNLDRFYKA